MAIVEFMFMTLRSLIFTLLFYLEMAVIAIVFLPSLLMPYPICSWAYNAWSLSMITLLKYVVGISHRIKGKPPTHQVIFAANHQSTWEAVFLYTELDKPITVLKRELVFIPLIGLYGLRAKSLTIDRKDGRRALKKLMTSAEDVKKTGRNILIFPQGTRSPVGYPAPYHGGVYAIYKATNLPVVPIAVNSGVFWPSDSFIKKSGVIDVEFLAQIPAGLDRKNFMKRLEGDIETAAARLPKA